MSCYEWEQGTLKLPTAEVAKLKRIVREAVNAEHERAYLEAREWARKHGAAYRRAKAKDKFLSPALFAYDRNLPALSEAAEEALLASGGKVPKRDQVTPARATSRSSVFALGTDAEIRFDGREVRWAVPENNHACERAHENPIARTFFAALDRIRWTRGSGGVIYGNNEYNRGPGVGPGGGGNFIKFSYGPLGKREAGYTTPDRNRQTSYIHRGSFGGRSINPGLHRRIW